jgi:hypothetical protein
MKVLSALLSPEGRGTTTEIGIKSSGSDPWAAFSWYLSQYLAKNYSRRITSSIRRWVQWGWTTWFDFRCGWSAEISSSSIAISAVFEHWALTSILASRQEHMITLYSINFFHGGIEKTLFSTPVETQKNIRLDKTKLNLQQYGFIESGTSANVRWGLFSLSISFCIKRSFIRIARVSVAGFEGAQTSMHASGCTRKICRTASTSVL